MPLPPVHLPTWHLCTLGSNKKMIRTIALLFVLSITGCNLYAFGDSITSHQPGHNASWTHYFELPHTEIVQLGQPAATCNRIYENWWATVDVATNADFLDIVVVMCVTPRFDLVSLEVALDAVVKMHQESTDAGLQFVFATHPAWHIDEAWRNPDAREFYDAVFDALPASTLFIDNDQHWKWNNYNLDSSNYTDGVHISEAGATLLGEHMGAEICASNKLLHTCGFK